MQLLGNLGSHIKVWSSGGAGASYQAWMGSSTPESSPAAVRPGRGCQGNQIEALLRAVGTLAVLRCGCSVASLRAGSVTLTDEIPNILQGLQQCSITIYQRSKLSVTVSLPPSRTSLFGRG